MRTTSADEPTCCCKTGSEDSQCDRPDAFDTTHDLSGTFDHALRLSARVALSESNCAQANTREV
jgi:hypothetical protein